MNIQIVFTTCATSEEARRLAKECINRRLAACIQRVPNIESTYWWNGKVVSSEEHLLLIKTTVEKEGDLIEFLKNSHSYEVPEVVSFEAVSKNKEYSSWLLKTLLEKE
ncbi:MAG: divalent-cation tolerance protein CutA [Pirellulaceae bacterium]|nr:divalent-cation tolerance protein CutA [Pirellulaceae bacterium]